MRMSEDRLTILVLTYNRYPRLTRLLRYVSSVQVPYKIRLLDSSTDPFPKSELQEPMDRIGVERRQYDASLSPIAKVFEGLKEVSTPYAVLWADDDFLVPRSLESGVRFLNQNPDYSIVHGESALFQMEHQGHQKAIRWIEPYPQRSLTDSKASRRLLDHLGGHYSVVFYSIHRTENLRKNMSLGFRHGFDRDARAELLSGSLSVIQGKTKKMDCLYMLREVHSEMGSLHEGDEGKGFEVLGWVTKPDFPSESRRFQDCLAQELAEADGIGMEEARGIVKRAFWSYLAREITEECGRFSESKAVRRSGWIGAARRSPVLRAAWHQIRPFLPGAEPELSLAALSRPTSKHHADFILIYRAISQQIGMGYS